MENKITLEMWNDADNINYRINLNKETSKVCTRIAKQIDEYFLKSLDNDKLDKLQEMLIKEKERRKNELRTKQD